jgi:hypothetical protein
MQTKETTFVIRAAAGDRQAFDVPAEPCRPRLFTGGGEGGSGAVATPLVTRMPPRATSP